MVTPVDDIFLPNRQIYDLSGGDTTLDMGAYAGFVVGISIKLTSVTTTGITFTAVHSTDGDSWTPIQLNKRNLEVDNTGSDDDLSLLTDLFILKNLGLQITNTGGATGTILVILSFK